MIFFNGKISKTRHDMPATNSEPTHPCITDQIMKDKNCNFEFRKVNVEEARKVLFSINNDKPPGSGNLDVKWLRMIGDCIATPICHLFNLSLQERVYPQAWRVEKVIPLPKNSKAPLPISLIPTLSKLLETNVFDQTQFYFTVNNVSFSTLTGNSTQHVEHLYKWLMIGCNRLIIRRLLSLYRA